jgi:two-component system, OmpR family, response regulator
MSACRVLYVEDEPDIRDVVIMSLALDHSLTVNSVQSATDALTQADEWRPDVILMDVVMPEMDGPQLLAQLRQGGRTADIPVVFMTARAQAEEVEHFLALGAAGVIAKPFDPLTLAERLRACLQGATRAA